MSQIITGYLHKSPEVASCALEMFRMRYRVFHERMRWDVTTHNGLEVDEYDDPQTLYMISRDRDSGCIEGSWRLRPTTTGYMMADVFPQLLYGQRPPQQEDIWEISRFAVECSSERNGGLGFGNTAQELVRAAIAHAASEGYRQYVMVVSVAVERLLRNMGLRLYRYGKPRRIGRVLTVACSLDIDAATCRTILGSDQGHKRRAA